jgi:hypothetical protein
MVLIADMFNNIKAKALLVACLVFSGTALPNGNEKRHWVGSWASMPQEVEPANLAPAPFVSLRFLLSLLEMDVLTRGPIGWCRCCSSVRKHHITPNLPHVHWSRENSHSLLKHLW